jgi:hypothetical protein
MRDEILEYSRAGSADLSQVSQLALSLLEQMV